MPSRIEDYAVLSDLQTSCLVAKDGSIDWFCVPRFDSPACFAALLGGQEHGRWSLHPRADHRRRRRYLPDTLVLETEYETATGRARVTDFMPLRGKAPDIVRIVEGVSGEMEFETDFSPRSGYGEVAPWISEREGICFAIAGPDGLRLDTPVKLDADLNATFRVKAGEKVPFVLTWFPSHETPPARVSADGALAEAVEFWREWSGRCTYRGEFREIVVRSLITLKGLTYEPTGGIVAAATTSLPEAIGGVRNWDYRYCWVRDATFTLYSLLLAGYQDEARAWREWLLRAVAGDARQMQIMYSLSGERRLAEFEAGWLPGYEGSRPVRIGNAAFEQFQLDVYGELMDTFHFARRMGLESEVPEWRIQCELLEFLEKAWREPDEGIWEVRGPRRHFTHSKVMAWVAFDRGIKAIESCGLAGPVESWKKTRDEIHAEVCEKGFSAKTGTFVQYYGATELDASLLLLTLVGFLPASHPKMKATIEAIEKDLVVDGFVMRYPNRKGVDGLPEGEGAFLACSFWLVDNLILLERRDDATALFRRLVGLCNDIGLLSEEYDPRAKRFVGNFPQAFSHVALVNSAFNLTEHVCPVEHRSR